MAASIQYNASLRTEETVTGFSPLSTGIHVYEKELLAVLMSIHVFSSLAEYC